MHPLPLHDLIGGLVTGVLGLLLVGIPFYRYDPSGTPRWLRDKVRRQLGR